MGNPQHLKWLLEGVEAWNARRERVYFTPDLRGTGLRGVDLWGANLRGADLRGGDLRATDLQVANLQGANLRGANLRGANLRGANLRGANMQGANLRGANLRGANMQGANLQEASLHGAHLRAVNIESVLSPNNSGDAGFTDISVAYGLDKGQLDSMSGDSGTIIPANLTRPTQWPDLKYEAPPDAVPTASSRGILELNAPLVRASALDFAFSDAGIEARLSEEQAIHPPLLAGGCGTRRDALIDNARHIARTINNQLAEQSRSDLIDYASHLETADPANPHRLNFIAVGIRADLEDDFKSGGFDNRLRRQLDDFLNQHKTFLNDCAPEAAEAIRVKADAALAEPVSKEQVTEMLDKLTTAIEATESATTSVEKMLEDMRAYDDELTALKLKITDARELVQHEARVQAEAKELITITSRLFWRAREAVEKYRPKDIHEIAAYVGAATGGYPAAVVIVTQLTPVMQWFGRLLTALPPL